MHLEPTREQLDELLSADLDAPVVMLNLLRFVPDGGAERYRRYGEAVLPLVTALGGRLVWQGRADGVVIGGADERWDLVALVAYPSRRAFLEMVQSDAYRAIADLRRDALADSRLVACTEQLAG